MISLFISVVGQIYNYMKNLHESFTQYVAEELSDNHLLFLGDIMQHRGQIRAERSKGFSYNGVFDAIAPYVDRSSFVCGNLETVFAGTKSHRTRGTEKDNMGPQFSSPDELASALFRAGIRAVTVQQNHLLDHGVGGFQRTIEILQAAGVEPIIDNRLIGDGQTRIALHNFTTHMNDVDDWEVRIPTTHPEADINIALPHWGGQFTDINDEQRKIADTLIERGFDAIIGTGPHIEHDVERIGDTIVAWSLGNFYSQHSGWNKDKPNRGIMLQLGMNNGKLEDYHIIPVETVNNKIVLR